jgi:D-glycerate 3-kinase
MNGPTASELNAFLEAHRLPNKFRAVIEEHYLPLARWIRGVKTPRTKVVGISGAQGTGKSTLADFLRVSLERECGWSVATLSLDDFYLTRVERRRLSKNVHPLLITRGAPGTHDLELCTRCMKALKRLEPGRRLELPRFDKADDDRFPAHQWPTVTGPIDLIILEGWCLGAIPQEPKALTKPINKLETTRDPDGAWRAYVNDQLRTAYTTFFATIDRLVFLRAPDFKAVHRWRLEQERKLAEKAGETNRGIMDETQLADFLQHFERLTRTSIDLLPGTADVILSLDENHLVTRSDYRRRT